MADELDANPQRQSAPAAPWRWSALSADQLLIVVLLVLIWAFISVLPLPPNDLWWHMAAGRAMVAEGTLLRTNEWAYSLPASTPYVYQSWLSELALYGLWWLGGVPLLALGRMVAVLLSYGLVAWHAWRRVGSGRAVALALLLAALVGWENWTMRPQTLALLPGAAFAVVLAEVVAGRIGSRWLWLLPALMALWVNLHGSFALGGVLLAVSWLSSGLQAWRLAAAERQTAWRRWCQLTGCGVLTALAMLLNPLGLGIVGYVRMMLGNEPLQRWFLEWQPPRNAFALHRTGFWFFALLLLIAVLMAYARRRPRLGDVLAYCALAWLAIGGIRYAMWFGLLLCPFVADLLSQRLGQPAVQPLARRFVLFCLLPLGLLVIGLSPWVLPRWQPAATASASEPYAALLSVQTPVGATDWLARNPIAGRGWVELDFSSYAIWRLPAAQVMADQRVELFPVPIWEDFIAITEGQPQTLALLERWQITHLLLSPRYQPKLANLMAQAPGWCERFRDQRSLIVARCQ